MAHIFVIEDDAPILRLLELFLTNGGHTVSASTQSPLALIKTLVAAPPDIILVDLMFGNQPEGWQAAQLLKTLPQTKDIPIILCSAADREVLALMESTPIKGMKFVSKPFDLDHLTATVNQSIVNPHALMYSQ